MREMRRKDREMSAEYAYRVIDAAEYGTLCVCDSAGLPVAVPLSIARSGDTLWFHSALAGEKVDALGDGAQVRIVFVDRVQVPDLVSAYGLEGVDPDSEKGRRTAYKLFTTEFSSAIVQGTVRQVSGEAEKLAALRLICERFTPQVMPFFTAAAEQSLHLTAVYQVKIEHLSGKRKQFDRQGRELTWQKEAADE